MPHDLHVSLAQTITNLLDAHESRIEGIRERQMQLGELLNEVHVMVTEFRDRASPQRTQDWFSPGEAARALGKQPYTVREWCRLRRINARKRPGGRGDAVEWEISAVEIERYRNHGLLPHPTRH